MFTTEEIEKYILIRLLQAGGGVNGNKLPIFQLCLIINNMVLDVFQYIREVKDVLLTSALLNGEADPQVAQVQLLCMTDLTGMLNILNGNTQDLVNDGFGSQTDNMTLYKAVAKLIAKMKLTGDTIYARLDSFRHIPGVREISHDHDEKARELVERFRQDMPPAWQEVATFPISINLHDDLQVLEIFATLAGYDMVA